MLYLLSEFMFFFAPIEIDCGLKKCKHTIIFKKHYMKDEWEAAVDKIKAGAGNCSVCGNPVPGRRGWSKYQSLHNHLFELCTEYPYSAVFLNII